MPKTTTNAFDLQWQNVGVRKASYRIEYKRRYWSGSAYVWEANWNTLKESDILKAGNISWKLSESQGDSALASNVSIVLHNNREQWNPSNTITSKWAADSTATLGYEPYLTKWQILYGYLLADGTFERPTLFTGFSELPQFESGSGKATFSITGREIMLETSNAQAIVNTFTNQSTSPATGDGSNLVFTTGNKSVWDISQVRVAGIVKTQGTDYTLSNMGDADKEATITFKTAPASAAAVDWTGQQWKRDQKISTLIGLLCDEAGITSSERTIEEPIFGSVDQSFTTDSQSDWDAGSESNTETGSKPGFVRLGEEILGGRFETQADLDDNWVHDSASTIKTDIPQEGSGYCSLSGSTSSSIAFEVRLVPTGAGATITKTLTKIGNWTLDTITAGVDGPYKIHFVSIIGGSDSSSIVSNSTISGNGTVVRFYYWWGSSLGFGGPATYELAIDNVRAITSTGTHTSQEIDLLATPTEWLPIEVVESLNAGTITIETNVSATSGSGYEGWVAVDGTNTPQSNLRRYFKYRINYTDNSTGDDGPETDKVIINWRSSSLFINQADFSGMDCFRAVSEFAKLADMEFGFNGDGTFFFRNKTDATTADFTLTESNAIARVSSVKPGYDKIKNLIQVRYGSEYYAEYNSTSAGESSPTSQEKFGDRIKPLSFNTFLFSNSASVSDAIAAKHYDGTPRRRASILMRMTPQMDLSDTVKASFRQDPKKKKSTFGLFGDDMQNAFPYLLQDDEGPSDVVLQEMLAKVIGIKFDLDNRRQTIDILEIV